MDFFLGEFTVSPEKLQIKIPFVELSHRQDRAFIDIFDTKASKFLLLVNRIFLQELSEHFLCEFTPKLREEVASGYMVEVGIDLLERHSRYSKYVIVHNVYL